MPTQTDSLAAGSLQQDIADGSYFTLTGKDWTHGSPDTMCASGTGFAYVKGNISSTTQLYLAPPASDTIANGCGSATVQVALHLTLYGYGGICYSHTFDGIHPFYVALIRRSASGDRVELWRSLDPSSFPTTLVSAVSFSITDGQYYTLLVEMDASNVVVSVDGTALITEANTIGTTLGYGSSGIIGSASGTGNPDVDTSAGTFWGPKFKSFSYTYNTNPLTCLPIGGGGGNPAQTLTPTTATIHPGETVHFGTNNAAFFGVVGNTGNNTSNASTVGGGSGRPADGSTPDNGSVYPDAGAGSNAADTGFTYTAPGAIGTYTVTAVDEDDDTNTAEAVITVVPVVVDIDAQSALFRGLLWDGEGVRKPLNTNRIRRASWTDERYGGWTQFTMELNVTLEDPDDATIVSQNDRIELWFYGERRYRGFVSSVTVTEDEPPTVTLAGYGIAFQASKPTVNHAFVYPQQVDIARVFADVAQEFVTPLFPDLVIEADPVDVTTQQVESTYKSVADALNDLTQNQGENLALWGGDADDDGNDRLYVKPFSSVTDWAIPVPGRNVTASSRETQSADIVNRLTILGGNPRYPNLLYNSSFERPRFSDASEGNILLNPNFEDATDWSGTGAYQAANSTVGNAFTGSRMWKTQGVGTYGTQTQNTSAVPVVPGWDYLVSVQAKREADLTPVQGLITLKWLNSGGGILQTDSLDTSTTTLSPVWRPFSFTSRAPAGATGYTLRLETSDEGGVGDGILWDAAEVAPASVIYQDKWEADVSGIAAIDRLNWAYRDGIDGGYCVLADFSALDADTDEAAIQPLAAERFEVQAGSTYTASAYLKSPPGVTSNGKLRLEVRQYDQDGVELEIDHINIAAGAGWVAWTQEYGDVTMTEDTTHVLFKIVWRGDSALLLDGVCFRDAAAGHAFIRDGQFVTTIGADNPLLLTLSAPALGSIGLYGYRDAVETVDGVNDETDALAYCEAYFNVHAPAFPKPTVSLVNDRRFFRPGQNVRLIGRDGDTLMGGLENLPIVKIAWQWDGMLRASLELQKELPDLASLLRKHTKRAIWNSAASSHTSSSTTSGTATGGPTGSGAGLSDAAIAAIEATVTATYPGYAALTTGGTPNNFVYSPSGEYVLVPI